MLYTRVPESTRIEINIGRSEICPLHCVVIRFSVPFRSRSPHGDTPTIVSTPTAAWRARSCVTSGVGQCEPREVRINSAAVYLDGVDEREREGNIDLGGARVKFTWRIVRYLNIAPACNPRIDSLDGNFFFVFFCVFLLWSLLIWGERLCDYFSTVDDEGLFLIDVVNFLCF